jgi:hypothetical protein
MVLRGTSEIERESCTQCLHRELLNARRIGLLWCGLPAPLDHFDRHFVLRSLLSARRHRVSRALVSSLPAQLCRGGRVVGRALDPS